MRFILWLGLGSIALMLVVWDYSIFMPRDHRKAADLTIAQSDLRSLSLALFDFDSQYSSYPDLSTGTMVKVSTNSPLTFGDATSNDFLKQLIAAGIIQSEGSFFAKTKGSKKPDNRFRTDAEALAAGECGFAYIPGFSMSAGPDTPICLTPMEPGKLTFDREAFDGVALILVGDCRILTLPIDSSGHVILNGMDLFDPRQPFWHGKVPDVKWPK